MINFRKPLHIVVNLQENLTDDYRQFIIAIRINYNSLKDEQHKLSIFYTRNWGDQDQWNFAESKTPDMHIIADPQVHVTEVIAIPI